MSETVVLTVGGTACYIGSHGFREGELGSSVCGSSLEGLEGTSSTSSEGSQDTSETLRLTPGACRLLESGTKQICLLDYGWCWLNTAELLFN